MKRIFIIHGYTGHPGGNWFPWLKSELEKLDVSAVVPAMPHTENPQVSEWLPYLRSQVGLPDEDTYLVGHSLGCITILRYLETLTGNTKAGGAVLVAGFASPIHLHELDPFFEPPLDDLNIKKRVKKIVAINSDNDRHVPYEQAEEIRNRFDAELIKIHNGEHLNEEAGYTEFPLVLDKLKEIMGL